MELLVWQLLKLSPDDPELPAKMGVVEQDVVELVRKLAHRSCSSADTL